MPRELSLLLLLLVVLGGGVFLILPGGSEGPAGREGAASPESAPRVPAPERAPVRPGPEAGPAGPKRVQLPPGGAVAEEVPTGKGAILEGPIRDSRGRGLKGVEVLLLRAAGRKPAEARRAAARYSWRLALFRGRMSQVAQLSDSRKAKALKGYLDRLLAMQGLKEVKSCRDPDRGAYRFEGVRLPREDRGCLLLLARAPAGLLDADPLPVQPGHLGPDRGPELVLLRPAAIKGDVSGLEPRRGQATVQAWRLDEAGRLLGSRQGWCRAGRPFSFDNLHPGQWRLAALQRYPEKVFAWGPVLALAEGEERDDVRIDLAGPCGLEVVFLDAGLGPMPCPWRLDVELVRAGPPGEAGEKAVVGENLYSLRGAENTPLYLENLSPGRYRLRAAIDWSTRHRPTRGKKEEEPLAVEREVVLERGIQRVEMVLEKPLQLGLLEVAVLDQQGRPLPEARARLRSGVGSFSRLVKAGDSGRILFDDLPPLRYRLYVYSRGHQRKDLVVDLRPRPGAREFLEVKLLRAAGLEGRLLDRDGAPLVRHRVMARTVGSGLLPGEQGRIGLGGGRTRSVLTGAGGSFSFDSLAPGTWRVSAARAGGGKVSRKVELKQGQQVRIELRFGEQGEGAR